MTEPKWILDEVVVAVHRRQIAEHGGMDGIRDKRLLESTLIRPRNLYHLGDPKPYIAEVAAAYAYGLARNHAFADGNKRTALVIYLLFLKLNGIELKVDASDKYKLFKKLASGELMEMELASWIA